MSFGKTVQASAAGAVLAMSMYLFSVLWRDASLSVFSPLPHQYGEGVLVWMARELDEGRSPYGDLLGAPSRYSCYGPLPAALTAAASRFVPGQGQMRYAVAGRILNISCWVIAGFLLGLLSGRLPPAFAMACAFPLAVSETSFMWTFRVDSFLAAIEAGILLVLARAGPRRMSALLPPLLVALALTKPPASVDLVPLVILAFSFTAHRSMSYARMVLPRLLGSGILALFVFFGLDWVQGGWMSDNILRQQMRSGWCSEPAVWANIANFLLRMPCWPILLWAAWGPSAAISRNSKAGLMALSISLVACGAASLKYGADVNYYVPTLLVMSALCSMRLTGNLQSVVFLVAVWIASVPLSASLAAHRNFGYYPQSQKPLSDFIVSAHSNDSTLTEDPFFSVLANRQPLITDMFQYNIAANKSSLVPQKLLEMSSSAWGGSRLRDFLANWGRIESTPPIVAAGVPYMPEAFIVKSTSGMSASSPPYMTKFNPPFAEYRRKVLVPAALIFAAALFWGPAYRSRRRRSAGATPAGKDDGVFLPGG